MVIEVVAGIYKEVITRTSKLRKSGLKLNKKLMTEVRKHWIDLVKTKFDGK